MKSRGIVVKLWTSIVLMTIVLLFLSMIFQTQFLNFFQYNQEKRLLREKAEKIARHYAITPYLFNAPIRDVMTKPNDIVIITDENSVITDIEGRTDYTRGMIYGRGYMEEIINRGYIFRENLMINNLRSLLVGVPIMKNMRNIPSGQIEDEQFVDSNENAYKLTGAVYVVTEISHLESIKSAIKQMFLFIYIGAIITASTISYLLSRSFSKPLFNINNAAKEIAKGNYNTVISLNSSDEIKMLGETINNLAKQLSRVEQIRREFIANVSHEIRTPLSYLQGYTEIMLDGFVETEEDRNRYLSIILEESKRLRNMVNEILQLSQVEAGYTQLKLLPFSVDALIKRMIEKIYPIATKRNISIKYNSVSDDILLCIADENYIRQVLINLLNNALKHSYDYGNILINTYRQNDRIYVCIRDFGEGISQEDLPFIWDRFYTSNKSNPDESTGLGLAIVKNIINAHKCEITVNSVKDEGTEFCFWLQTYIENELE